MPPRDVPNRNKLRKAREAIKAISPKQREALRWAGFGLDLPTVHRHHDVFETLPEPIPWFGNWTVQFATGVEGHIESLAVPLEPAVAPIVFRRLRQDADAAAF